jgi:D-arabinose 1-dehydrogenase-like Zn-dependent alcohol dehydrogenase
MLADIADAVLAEHDLNAYIALLKRDGTLTLVGAPPMPHIYRLAFSHHCKLFVPY